MFSRRGVLLLAAAAAQGCAGPAPPPPPLSALEAGLPGRPQRQPLLLDVARVEVAPIPAGPAFFVIPPAPIAPADAMVAMARERLRAAGNARTALFSLLTARLGRHPSDPGRLFSGRTEMLHCTLRCRLDILAPDDALLGTTGAEVQRSATVPASSAAELAESSARFMRVAMADLELEFENQVRRDLGAFLADRAAAGRARPG